MYNYKNRQVALTTEDNPYDPFDEFDEWYNYDLKMGYGTAEYLARVMRTAKGLSDAWNNEAVEAAVDEIVALNLLGNYKKVVKETAPS